MKTQFMEILEIWIITGKNARVRSLLDKASLKTPKIYHKRYSECLLCILSFRNGADATWSKSTKSNDFRTLQLQPFNKQAFMFVANFCSDFRRKNSSSKKKLLKIPQRNLRFLKFQLPTLKYTFFSEENFYGDASGSIEYQILNYF